MKTIRVSQLVPRQLILVDHLIDQVPRTSFLSVRPGNVVFLHEVFDCSYVEMIRTRISVPLSRTENFIEICARKVTFAKIFMSNFDTSVDLFQHFVRSVHLAVHLAEQWRHAHTVIVIRMVFCHASAFCKFRFCVVQVDS